MRCEIFLAEGEGACTETEHGGDQHELAIVTQSGPIAQTAFDERHGQIGADWIGHRAGLNQHDVEATMAAIRTRLPDPDPAPRLQELATLEQEARDLTSTDEARRLIERVATALDLESVLNKGRLRELLS